MAAIAIPVGKVCLVAVTTVIIIEAAEIGVPIIKVQQTEILSGFAVLLFLFKCVEVGSSVWLLAGYQWAIIVWLLVVVWLANRETIWFADRKAVVFLFYWTVCLYGAYFSSSICFCLTIESKRWPGFFSINFYLYTASFSYLKFLKKCLISGKPILPIALANLDSINIQNTHNWAVS